MNLRKMGQEGVDSTHQTQYRDRQWALEHGNEPLGPTQDEKCLDQLGVLLDSKKKKALFYEVSVRYCLIHLNNLSRWLNYNNNNNNNRHEGVGMKQGKTKGKKEETKGVNIR